MYSLRLGFPRFPICGFRKKVPFKGCGMKTNNMQVIIYISWPLSAHFEYYACISRHLLLIFKSKRVICAIQPTLNTIGKVTALFTCGSCLQHHCSESPLPFSVDKGL